MESWEGKIAKYSIEMALSDFYREHSHYKTRLVLHTRDSKGQPTRALSAALNLLDVIKVEAIIDPKSQLKIKLLEEILGEKARIPIVSFLHKTTQPSKMYPFSVQITQDESSQVKGIVDMVEAFKWRDIVIIYDHLNDQSEVILPHLVDLLHKKNISISYEKALLNSTSYETIVEELKKMKDFRTKLFIVHLSPIFLSSLLSNAAKLGMMSKGYSWLFTTTCTNGLHFLNSSVIESMQGVIGFKNYRTDPWKRHHFSSRMRMELSMEEEPDEKILDHLISSLGIWAYDGIWCLAKAIEREKSIVPFGMKLKMFPKIGSFGSGFGSLLLKEFLKTELSGLSGGVRFRVDGKLKPNAFVIANMIRNGGEKRAGFWSFRDGTKMERRKISRWQGHGSSPDIDWDAVTWNGGSNPMPKIHL